MSIIDLILLSMPLIRYGRPSLWRVIFRYGGPSLWQTVTVQRCGVTWDRC